MASSVIAGIRVHVDSVSYAYAAGPLVLSDLSFEVTANSVVAICGPSGCGKTTLLRLIAGAMLPQRGLVSLLQDGSRYEGPIGVVTQQFTNFEWMTARRNVMRGAQASGLDEMSAGHEADRLLTEFGLARFGGSYPAMLSGGQQQRVAFARAVASRAGLLILDEPFSALDPPMRLWMASRVLGDRERIGTVLIVTHDLNEAIRHADEVLVLSARTNQLVAVSLRELGPPDQRDPLAMALKHDLAISLMLTEDAAPN